MEKYFIVIKKPEEEENNYDEPGMFPPMNSARHMFEGFIMSSRHNNNDDKPKELIFQADNVQAARKIIMDNYIEGAKIELHKVGETFDIIAQQMVRVENLPE